MTEKINKNEARQAEEHVESKHSLFFSLIGAAISLTAVLLYFIVF